MARPPLLHRLKDWKIRRWWVVQQNGWDEEEGEKLSWELCLPGDTLQLINCIGEGGGGVAGWLCAKPVSKCVRLLSLEIIW